MKPRKTNKHNYRAHTLQEYANGQVEISIAGEIIMTLPNVQECKEMIDIYYQELNYLNDMIDWGRREKDPKYVDVKIVLIEERHRRKHEIFHLLGIQGALAPGYMGMYPIFPGRPDPRFPPAPSDPAPIA